MSKLKRILVLIFLFEFIWAGPWPRKSGENLLLLQYYHYNATYYVDKYGLLHKNSKTFYKDEISIYYEYGLNSTHTFTLRAPYTNALLSRYNGGLGDLDFGLINMLNKQDNNVLSWETGIMLPGTYLAQEPYLGYRVGAWSVGILYGESLSNGYFTLRTGFKDFLGNPSDWVYVEALRAFNAFDLHWKLNLSGFHGLANGREFGESNFVKYNQSLLQGTLACEMPLAGGILGIGYQKDLLSKNNGLGQAGFISWENVF